MRHRNYVRLTEYSSVSTNNSPDQSNRGKLEFLIAAKAESDAFVEQCRREVAAARPAKGE
ncbi:hypothetical protein [Rhodopirellula baltica]